jgi:hypothetical protein
VTAVNGVVTGAGFGMALLGNAVLVSTEARLEFAYLRVGLTGDDGSTLLLPRLIALRRAQQITLLDLVYHLGDPLFDRLEIKTVVNPWDRLCYRRRYALSPQIIAERITDSSVITFSEALTLLQQRLSYSPANGI